MTLDYPSCTRVKEHVENINICHEELQRSSGKLRLRRRHTLLGSWRIPRQVIRVLQVSISNLSLLFFDDLCCSHGRGTLLVNLLLSIGIWRDRFTVPLKADGMPMVGPFSGAENLDFNG